jgi:hypothetical protein
MECSCSIPKLTVIPVQKKSIFWPALMKNPVRNLLSSLKEMKKAYGILVIVGSLVLLWAGSDSNTSPKLRSKSETSFRLLVAGHAVLDLDDQNEEDDGADDDITPAEATLSISPIYSPRLPAFQRKTTGSSSPRLPLYILTRDFRI